jgi:hypothetical protein
VSVDLGGGRIIKKKKAKTVRPEAKPPSIEPESATFTIGT